MLTPEDIKVLEAAIGPNREYTDTRYAMEIIEREKAILEVPPDVEPRSKRLLEGFTYDHRKVFECYGVRTNRLKRAVEANAPLVVIKQISETVQVAQRAVDFVEKQIELEYTKEDLKDGDRHKGN